MLDFTAVLHMPDHMRPFGHGARWSKRRCKKACESRSLVGVDGVNFGENSEVNRWEEDFLQSCWRCPQWWPIVLTHLQRSFRCGVWSFIRTALVILSIRAAFRERRNLRLISPAHSSTMC